VKADEELLSKIFCLNVKLSSSCQLSPEEAFPCPKKTPPTRVHVERVIRRLKNYRIVSQTVPIDLAPKFDKILRVCRSM
jgi:hypothetical protein